MSESDRLRRRREIRHRHWQRGGFVFLVAAVIGAIYFSTAQQREQARHEREQKEVAAKERETAIQERKAAEEAAAGERRRKAQVAAISSATDAQLKSLYDQCRRRISKEIETESKPAFAVYFPEYSAYDLDQLATMAIALRSSTGRPSQILNRDDFASRQVEILREVPGRISIVAESASDSFSGVVKWAAEYKCELDGLSIASVRRVSSRHFFK